MSVELDWTTADYADGPGVAAWLAELDQPLPAGLKRRMSDWRSGQRAGLVTLDRWLTKIDLHLSEVPGDLWREGPHRGSIPQADRRAAASLAVTCPVKQVARLYGVAPATVRYWREQEVARG